MEKKEKLNLDNLKIQSFITTLDQKRIKGGNISENTECGEGEPSEVDSGCLLCPTEVCTEDCIGRC